MEAKMIIPADTTITIEKRSKKFTKIEQIIIWMTTIYVWIVGVILIYWIFLKITGQSPETVDILIALNSVILAAMLGGGLTIGIKLGKLERVAKQFDSLARDFKKHLEIEHKKKI